jgi:hypothetical protein
MAETLNSYEQWTKDDTNMLEQYYKQGYTYEQMSIIFNRTKVAIRSKLKRMDILKTNKRFSRLSIIKWSDKEIKQLVKLYGCKKFTIREMAFICEKSIESVKYKLFQMKLNGLKKRLSTRSYAIWTNDEIDRMIKLIFEYGCSKRYVAKLLGRTINAIDMKLKSMLK